MPALTKPKDRRNSVMGVRLTQSEAEALELMSEQEAISVSDLIRTKLFPSKATKKPKRIIFVDWREISF